MRFEEDSLVIPSYFGRDFRIPLRAEGVAPPSAFIKYYPFDVKGCCIRRWCVFGDTALMWLYRVPEA
jgi:hypothetical protein